MLVVKSNEELFAVELGLVTIAIQNLSLVENAKIVC
jgi:hypothetical protein